MGSSRYPEADLSKVKRTSIAGRKSKVHLADLAAPPTAGMTLSQWMGTLAHVLAGEDLRSVVDAIVAAARSDKPVIASFGAHVIKCGQGPVLADLMQRGIVKAIATNGAGAIHDAELALFGETSEHVEEGLGAGQFGMMKETADFLNLAAKEGSKQGLGFGEAVGRALIAADAPNRAASVFAAAYEQRVPATVHVGIGTDIVHMHPTADGAAIGDVSMRDFRILIHALGSLGGGGVLLNIGSAVIMPEVILKAFTVLRNTGVDLAGFTSVNLDFLQNYRSTQQVVSRVKELGGRGLYITGHHEILVGLIAAAVVDLLG